MVYFKTLGESEKSKSAINSGLGNGLFQISSTIGLALSNNDTAVFPYWRFSKYFKNNINEDDVSNFKITKEYYEPHFHYREIPYMKGMNLNGYFQSEKYFYNHREFIKKIFTLKDEYEVELKNKWKNVLKNSVSIHVRRTDYIKNESIGGIIVCPKLDYFENSLKYIEKYKKIENILVFSDDIKWCKENFNDSRIIFIENQTEIFDMFLMSFCENNITQNSTFSWWGSWLNNNTNKIVTIPKLWFNPTHTYMIAKDLYRDDMVII